MATLQNFETEKIKGDVIDDIPNEKLSIKYQSQASVELDPKSLYTLMFVDPDAPSRKDPKFRNILHQLINNIPGSDVSKGEIAVEYIGSGPPLGTGKHRYIFLVFKQPDGKRIKIDERVVNTTRKGRLNFDVRGYIGQHQLGKPIAGNFYLAEYDDYVPILHAQLSKS